jgi:succinyl-CoA synthetase beta subunit
VLKLIDPLLPHRAKVGAVHVGLAGPDEVRSAFDTLGREHGARQVLIAEQLPVRDGVELIAGVVADPVFGTRALLGAGGVDANDARDSFSLVPPYDPESVRHTVSRLRVSARIGRDVADELAAILRGLAALVTAPAGAPVTEVECNPVLVTGDATVVLDALAFVEETHD